jgi:hypothetical protein
LNEPLDNEISPEPPTVIAEGIGFLHGKNPMSAEHLSAETGLPLRNIENLAGLRPGEINPDVKANIAVTSPRPSDPVGEAKDDAAGKDGSVLNFPKNIAR